MVASVIAAVCGVAALAGMTIGSVQPCCGDATAAREVAKAPTAEAAIPVLMGERDAASRVLRGATIDSVAFLEGDWSAKQPGTDGATELTQEVWSAPSGNNMMGMFRWLGGDGVAVVFEMLTITEEDDTLVLRLRHQDAQGNAWEAQDKPATLHLTELASGDPASDTPSIAIFEDTAESCDLAACEYDRSVEGKLTITVRFDDADHEDLVFELASPDAPVSSDGGGGSGGSVGAGGGGREKAPGADTALSPEDAAAVFERFAGLEGEWVGRSTRGWEERIIYQAVAGGSVVVERSFEAHPGEQMFTMTHMDGDRLMLTHYCVARNQPRLVCTGWDAEAGTATFEFLDATNIASRDQGHMDKVVVRFVDDAHFTSQWTWYEAGVESWMEEIVLERAGDAQAPPEAP